MRSLGSAAVLLVTGCTFESSALLPGGPSPDGGGTDATADRAGPDGPPPSPFCDPTDNDLVACYTFEPPTSPNVLHDGSKYGNDGTTANVLYAGGHDGMAISMGTGSKVTVDDRSSLDPTNALTIEMWVNPSSVPATWSAARVGLCDKDTQYGIFIYAGGTVGCNTSVATVRSGVGLSTNSFTHVACVLDPAHSSLTLYMGGVPVAVAAAGDPLATSTSQLVIGADSPCTTSQCNDAYQGLIDDLRIYQVARTPGQICKDAGLCP
jgi:hypothetical protein